MKIISREIPEEFRSDVLHAVDILKEFGCTEIYLFGSLATGEYSPVSDIDFAVKGLPPGMFFKVSAKLYLELDHHFDLIRLDDENDRFGTFVKAHEVFMHVA